MSIYDVSEDGIQNSIKIFLMNLNFDSIEIVDLLEFKLLLLSRDLITFDDFEFKGEYKDFKKDGSISKKEPIVSLDFYSLKKS